MPKIYDNIQYQLLEGLQEILPHTLRTDFCVGYFNLRGWKKIAPQIEAMTENCRLLVGMQKTPLEAIKEEFSQLPTPKIDTTKAVKLKQELAEEFRKQLTIGIPTTTDEIGLRELLQQLKSGKLQVKLHTRYPLHAKLYLCYLKDRGRIEAFLGSSNLTSSGLAHQGELNIDVLEQDASNKLATWFEDRWEDRFSLDISKELMEVIENSWAREVPIPPYYVYLKMAYHLSSEARAGISQFNLPKVFEKELLDFQQKAVLVAAKYLHQRNGVLIGDVVGLGKTITAVALAKLFEEDFFYETLVICPKNLTDMWEGYFHKYKLHGKVLSASMAGKELPTLRRYRIVIVDESHNLRNPHTQAYAAIKDYLTKNDSKVILLSATPYNKTYLDLSSQLRLFLPDEKDLGTVPQRYIAHLGGEAQFQAKHTDTFIRSIKAFEKSEFAEDWQELMRMFLVRRTRSFVKTHYAKLDENNQRRFLEFSDSSRSYFPERLPKKVEYGFDAEDKNDQYAKLYAENVAEAIASLILPRYGLSGYLVVDVVSLQPTKEELTVINNLSKAGKRLIGFCRTNLFKRLESSGHCFLLSLKRHILRNYLFIYAIENDLPIPIGKNGSSVENFDSFLTDLDIEEEASNAFDDEAGEPQSYSAEELTAFFEASEQTYLQKAQDLYNTYQKKYKKRFNWIRSAFFKNDLKVFLKQDAKKITDIFKIAGTWKPEQDKQLYALAHLIQETHKGQKVLVFTQFADTAYYLKAQLDKLGIKKLACATGQEKNPTQYAQQFSPKSNKMPEITPEQELQVLVATDVLSEGQNLQDAHIIVNYDLPWAIIRLIQRAGRVDRIGQKAEKIYCYSFLPEDGLERIINLRSRLSQRITENAEVVGSDETFFEGDPINMADLYSEKNGILDELESDAEVDLSSYCYQIWKEATDQTPKLLKIIPELPLISYSTKKHPTPLSAKQEVGSVIVYAHTQNEHDMLTQIDREGNIISQSQYHILKNAECLPVTPAEEKQAQHHELVQKAIMHLLDEEKHIGGALGKITGLKSKTYNRLTRFFEENRNTLFVTDALKKAIDDIYNYPLKEYARTTLNRQIDLQITDAQLANLVVSLYEENKLCIVHQDNESQENREPQIICSLGIA